MQTFILITIVVIATIHLMMASVLSLYSRYKVQYLSLAWIMGIFGALCCVAIPFSYLLRFENIGLLHPFMLLALVGTCFLQGIYPLSIPMPGYLQWGRMWRYASPAIFLIILYVVSLLLGNRPVIVHTYSELADCCGGRTCCSVWPVWDCLSIMWPIYFVCPACWSRMPRYPVI